MKRFKFNDAETLRIFSEAVAENGRKKGREYATINRLLPSNHPLVNEARDALRESLRLQCETNEEVHRLHVLGRCHLEECAAKTVEDSEALLADTRASAAGLYARLDADQRAADLLGEMSESTALAVAEALLGVTETPLLRMLSEMGANVIFVDTDENGETVVVSKSEEGKPHRF